MGEPGGFRGKNEDETGRRGRSQEGWIRSILVAGPKTVISFLALLNHEKFPRYPLT